MRYIITYICLLGMEISWLYAVLNAVNKAVSDRLSVPMLLLTILVSFGISRFLRFIHWPKPALAALVWAIWPVVMLVMIKIQLFPSTAWADTEWLKSIPEAFVQIFYSFLPALLIIVSTLVLWWLGRRLAYLKVNFTDALTEFQFGLVILVITFFCCYEFNLDQSSSLPAGLVFFSLALTGISISNDRDNTWFSSSRKGEWSGILLLCIGLVLLLGILISVIVTPDLLQLFINAVIWIWGLIEKFLTFLAGLFPQQSAPIPAPEQAMPAADNQTFTLNLPEWLQPGLKLIYFILIGGFLIFTVYRVVSDIAKWMRRQTSKTGGEMESLRGAFWADLLNFFKRILSRIFGFKFRSRARKLADSTPPDLAYVRQIYIQLLGWGVGKGFARQKSQTPLEYKNVLGDAMPENKSDLEFITGQYMEARYGYNQPGEENLGRLKLFWNNLKKAKRKGGPEG
jgi:hypothetical protein